MNVGDRVKFTDMCEEWRDYGCASCEYDGWTGVIVTSAQGQYVVEFTDGFLSWANARELEAAFVREDPAVSS